MEKFESSCSILARPNLDDVEMVVRQAYHRHGSGRPPRKPMGIFKALIIRRLQHACMQHGEVLRMIPTMQKQIAYLKGRIDKQKPKTEEKPIISL